MAAAIVENTGFFVKSVLPNNGIVQVVVRTDATVDATNTLVFTLSKYGIGPKGFIGLIAFKATTDNSVYVQEACTTAVASGVLTITVPSGTSNDPRFIIFYGQGVNP